MKKIVFILTFCTISVLLISAFTLQKSKPKAGIQRIVCFKFKTDASPEAIEKHMKGFAALKKGIPQILSYSAGKTVVADGQGAPEYDVMHYTTYENEQAVLIYNKHAVHQKFVAENKDIWEKVLVINSELK